MVSRMTTPIIFRARRPGIAVSVVSLLVACMLLIPSTPSHADSAGFVQFYSVIGKGVRADCYLSWIPNSDDPGEIRCDRYKDVRGVVTQQVSLVVDDGRGRRADVTDATGDRVGRRIGRGATITRARFLHCQATKKSMRCWNSYTHHGFVLKRRGFRLS